MPISDWPLAERPRERLLNQGAEALSDAELLAIYLRVGTQGKSAVGLARDLLAHFDGRLDKLGSASWQDLSAVHGIGQAKAAQLKASFELGRRVLAQKMVATDSLHSPSAVREWLRMSLSGQEKEIFMALWLNSQNQLIKADILFQGTLTQSAVYPREVVKIALQRNAAGVILAHNHPSGIAEPSHADELLTRTLQSALSLVDIKVVDHLIVAGNQPPLSFAERGLL